MAAGWSGPSEPGLMRRPRDRCWCSWPTFRMIWGRFAKCSNNIGRAATLWSAAGYMKGGRLIGGPWLKQLLSHLSGLTLCWFRRIPTHDATNAFKIYDRAMLGNLRIESKGGFELSLEITVKAFLAGYTITETPSTWERPDGGHIALQALEVVTALSQVVFHGLPA